MRNCILLIKSKENKINLFELNIIYLVQTFFLIYDKRESEKN